MSLITRFIILSAVTIFIDVVVASLLVQKQGRINWLAVIYIIVVSVLAIAVNIAYLQKSGRK